MKQAGVLATAFFVVLLAHSGRAETDQAAATDRPAVEGIAAAAVVPLRVGYSPIVPFISAQSGHEGAPRGFEVDVVAAVAAGIGRPVTWVPARNVRDNLDQVASGAVDLAVGGISITRAREGRVDFSYPVTRSGLGILVTRDTQDRSTWDRLTSVLKGGRLGVLVGFILLLVVAGHLVWFAERGSPSFDDRYIPGVFEGMYWAIVTASTVGYGDKAPAKWAGRVVAGLVIVVSLPMFAIFTAELSSAITLEAVQNGAISAPKDLADKGVAAIAGSTGADWATRQHARLHPAEDLDDAVALLKRGEVTAVVYDTPALTAVAQRESELVLVPGDFDPLDVGFAVAENSPLREAINRELLSLREQGTIDDLKAAWFPSATP